MIISASRRTDIPAFYSDWFFHRIRQGYALVRNPMNFHQVSRVALSPDVVDCIVFWTKNPEPMLDRLGQLADYHFYFQFTLNPYGLDVEANVPRKARVVETFRRLSAKIGTDRVIWRYDPIFLNAKYTPAYHVENFEKLAARLQGYTKKCTISFLDFYPSVRSNLSSLGTREMDRAQQWSIAEALSEIAFRHGIKMDACCEDTDFSGLGIGRAKCIDGSLISKLIGSPVRAEKDRNQRSGCGCAASVDIGSYNTCCGGCKYCYASHSPGTLRKSREKYNAESPLLCGFIGPGDRITKRKMSPPADGQINLFSDG